MSSTIDPRLQRLLGAAHCLFAGATVLCLWLVPDPFSDPSTSLTLLSLLALQIPALLLVAKTRVKWEPARPVRRG